jgi:hypothetical protein
MIDVVDAAPDAPLLHLVAFVQVQILASHHYRIAAHLWGNAIVESTTHVHDRFQDFDLDNYRLNARLDRPEKLSLVNEDRISSIHSRAVRQHQNRIISEQVVDLIDIGSVYRR